MKRLGIILLVLLLLSGCGAAANLDGLEQLNAALTEAGYDVTQDGPLDRDIFTGERYRFLLNEDEALAVTAYLYDSADKAANEAAGIDDGGCGIDITDSFGRSKGVEVSWVSEPHFFLYENIIVQYVGTDAEVLEILQQVCGEQIAGMPIAANSQSQMQK